MPVKVWLGGEGNNELGREDGYGGREPGVVEVLVRRVVADGWTRHGVTVWQHIRKFRAGQARHLGQHGDYQNVCGLVLEAYEAASELVVFVRDADGDRERAVAIRRALAWIAEESGWMIAVVGDVAEPTLEGWILALSGEHETDGLSRKAASDHIALLGIPAKSTDGFAEVAATCELDAPPSFGLAQGTESLQRWLAAVHEILDALVHGRS